VAKKQSMAASDEQGEFRWENPRGRTPEELEPPTKPTEARWRLENALRLDLIGPWPGHPLETEQIPRRQRPSNWYLTGFLIPTDSPEDHMADDDVEDELDTVPEEGTPSEESSDDGRPAKRGYFPSSIGLTFLVDSESCTLTATAQWGDYAHGTTEGRDGEEIPVWQRTQRMEPVTFELGGGPDPIREPIPNAHGLFFELVERGVETESENLPKGVRSVSLFLVNGRRPLESSNRDAAFAFQAEIVVETERGFVPRPDLRGEHAADWDGQLADLHYADSPDFATGHGVSADWDVVDGHCHTVRTAWIPAADVERTVTRDIAGVMLEMDALGTIEDGSAVRTALAPMLTAYREWIEARRSEVSLLKDRRRVTAEVLLHDAAHAAGRIEAGIGTLERDPDALDAFRLANRAVSRALKQRFKAEHSPRWRAFQLAFILLNLSGLADPEDANRETVDLLFFPTGGGKTEAYLGLAAFTMALRRLRHPAEGGRAGAGVSVIMRYTLRLLTLDQLMRAAGLVCALELEREADAARYGEWPFEIGLWVGKAATPNKMGRKGDDAEGSARSKVRRFKANPRSNPSPIPLTNCPWCDTAFEPDSFALQPNDDLPRDLRVVCMNPDCEFCGDRQLPIVAVDEPLYRRLPAFLIATVDKFAALPWQQPSGALLGGATELDGQRLQTPLQPPDLVIQDELHLISGPLGTIAGLYEASIEGLMSKRGPKPKIVASTATIRSADGQVAALFGRLQTRIFPPQGPSRKDSFFAEVVDASRSPARRYIGIAAQGRNPKTLMRRVWLPLMCAAQTAYLDAGGFRNKNNPADPYMSVLGYFNSLKELGGGRRILEEEVQNAIKDYAKRRRFNEMPSLFRNRERFSEVVELTSRVSATEVARARARLGSSYSAKERVDCAIATNMISVGLDIPRLGLMVVLGQPKTHSEYIQATSRVGRTDESPGLVICLLNIHKPRDRSHYERFRNYHETFYRSVEATSVTPFSARALDRAFAGALVSYARHSQRPLGPPRGAMEVATVRRELEDELLRIFQTRVGKQPYQSTDEESERLRSVQNRVVDLLDSWTKIVAERHEFGTKTVYQDWEARDQGKRLLLEMLDEEPESKTHRKFRVGRSMRDVEPEVHVRLHDPGPRGHNE